MSLNFSLFNDPKYGGAGIARSWVNRAIDLQNQHGFEADFERFTAVWSAFCAWGMCVSLQDSDAKMLRDVGADQSAREIFNTVTANRRFYGHFSHVAPSFPLPSFSDLIRLDPYYDWRGHRDGRYWEKIARANADKKQVRLSPELNPEEINWYDFLQCMYKVRCNLAHGGKMPSREEGEFVSIFSEILLAVITEGLFELRGDLPRRR